MKTKYILHGGYTRKNNELNKSFFQEFAIGIPNEGTILMCFFASGQEDKSDVFEELQQKFIKNSSGKNIHFALATEVDFLHQVKSSHGLYFHGGHTNTLLSKLKKYSNLESYFDNKTVAGSSAGAYMLARYGTAHNEEYVREGLGFVDVRVVCHYASDELPPTETSLHEILQIKPQFELVLLRDCEWKVFNVEK
jgi:peptidase E